MVKFIQFGNVKNAVRTVKTFSILVYIGFELLIEICLVLLESFLEQNDSSQQLMQNRNLSGAERGLNPSQLIPGYYTEHRDFEKKI